MKKLLAGLLMSVSMFIYQCDQLPQSTLEDAKKSVKIAIVTPPHFDTIAYKAVATVSGYNMDTLTHTLFISDSSITGTITNIPSGGSRFFEINVYDFNGKVLYYGNTWANIYPGTPTYVYIVLKKPNGTAIINGIIEDDPIPQDTLWVSQPYILQYFHGLPLEPDSVIFSVNTNIQYPRYYSWLIDDMDSATTYDNTFSYKFDRYGTHTINVSVSDGSNFISSKKLIFTVTDSDTGVIDTGIIDTGIIDTGIIDTGIIDTGIIDTGIIDTGIIDTGIIDTTFIPQEEVYTYNFPVNQGILPVQFYLRQGDTVTISAHGNWTMDSTKAESWTGPEGFSGQKRNARYTEFPLGGLLGFISDSDTQAKPFFIGSNYVSTNSSQGVLFFIPNQYKAGLQGKEAGSMNIEVHVYRFRP